VLENKNMNNLKFENSIHFPNLTSLMKISLGLIFFTIFSTSLVYAQSESTNENAFTINVIENAYLKDNFRYLDTSTFSTYPGESFILTNNDVVSHKFISGSSNVGEGGITDYTNYLICELGEIVSADVANVYTDEKKNLCSFNMDNRIITDIISPGESISISVHDVGTYRIIDPDYPWMQFAVYVFPQSSSPQDDVNEQIPISEPIIVIPPTVQTVSINVDGVFYDVEYIANGLTIMDIESDLESKSLIFSVDVVDLTGTLDVTLDRTFFDSIYDGTDDPFFILADGDESISEEIETTPQSRTLSIKVPSGTEELEIIGSVFKNSKVLEPIIEEPIIEEPIIEEISNNQCGPGTTLENNVCVLDQRCGPGTTLEDGSCVLDSTPLKSTSSGNSKELILGIMIAFGIASIVGIIFALISRVNRNKN